MRNGRGGRGRGERWKRTEGRSRSKLEEAGKDVLRERYGGERDGGRAPVGGKKGEKLAARRPGAQSTLSGGGGRGRQC